MTRSRLELTLFAGLLCVGASFGGEDDALDAIYLLSTQAVDPGVKLGGNPSVEGFKQRARAVFEDHTSRLNRAGGWQVTRVVSRPRVDSRHDQRDAGGKLVSTGLTGTAQSLAVLPLGTEHLALLPGTTLERVEGVALTVVVYEVDERGLPVREIGESRPMIANAHDLSHAAESPASYSATKHGALLRHLYKEASREAPAGSDLKAEVRLRRVDQDGAVGEPLGHTLRDPDQLLSRTTLAILRSHKQGLSQGGRHRDLTGEEADSELRERRERRAARRAKSAAVGAPRPGDAPPVAAEQPKQGFAQALGD